MEITKNKFVAVQYELRLESFDGELVEKTRKNEPEKFVFGHDQMLDVFENQLAGKKAGESFKIKIPPEEAFGEYDPLALVEFTEEEFIDLVGEDNNDFETGAFFPVEDEDGNQYDGFIADINNERVVIDFNHPLAGETLFFSGKVIEVRDSTKKDFLSVQ
ncbi:MAG: FKBP-type peptidyl-prolyl cis-trans isomerase [Bacteroidota bacterium]